MPNPEPLPPTPLQLIPDGTGYWGAKEIATRMHWTTRSPYKPLIRHIQQFGFPAFKRKRLDQRHLNCWFTEEWLIRRWMNSMVQIQRESLLGQRREQDNYRAKGLRPPRIRMNT